MQVTNVNIYIFSTDLLRLYLLLLLLLDQLLLHVQAQQHSTETLRTDPITQ